VAEQGVRERWVWHEGGEGLKGPGFEFSLPILLALDGIDQLLANGPGPLILGEKCLEKWHWTWLTMCQCQTNDLTIEHYIHGPHFGG